MSKNIIINHNPFQKLIDGVNELADIVALTLGPAGKNILIDKGESKPPLSTRDGVTVARSIFFKDKIKNFAAQLIKQCASDTNKIAGDGTTTATILARSIYLEGLKKINAGLRPIDVKRSIDEATKHAVEKLKLLGKQITTFEDIKSVATISANNDPYIGEFIAQAIYKVGSDGTVLVENSNKQETYLKFQEGMTIERGLMDTSPYFCTDFGKRIAEFINPYFLIIDDRIHDASQLDPILRICIKEKLFPLIVSVREIEDSVLAFLVANKIKGGMQIAVIKTPGTNNSDIIEDFSVKVAGNYFNPDWHPLTDFKPDDLGKSDRAIIGARETTIIGGAGSIDERIKNLKIEEAQEPEEGKKAIIKNRINSITNQIGAIYVGADSDTELQDTRLRVEDSLNATKAASKEGIVIGGGIAFLQLICLLELKTPGCEILQKAFEEPSRIIIKNSEENWEKIFVQLSQMDINDKNNYGFDAKTKSIRNMYEAGIIDPILVTRTALQKASSVAGMLLTTGATIENETGEK